MIKYQNFSKYLQKGLTALLAGLQLVAGFDLAEAAKYVHPEKRKILFVETQIGHSKKREFLDQIVGRKPDYVDAIEIADEEPKLQLNVLKSSYAATMPVDSTKIGKGTRSRILVFKRAFGELNYPPYLGGDKFAGESVIYSPDRFKFSILDNAEMAADLEFIVKNDILHGQFSAAKHLSQGIYGYPITMFYDSAGNFNFELFIGAISALSAYEKYKALKPLVSDTKDSQLKFELKLFRNEISLFHNLLSYPEFTGKIDPAFIQKLRWDFNQIIKALR